jgi:hypothetical protein
VRRAHLPPTRGREAPGYEGGYADQLTAHRSEIIKDHESTNQPDFSVDRPAGRHRLNDAKEHRLGLRPLAAIPQP